MVSEAVFNWNLRDSACPSALVLRRIDVSTRGVRGGAWGRDLLDVIQHHLQCVHVMFSCGQLLLQSANSTLSGLKL